MFGVIIPFGALESWRQAVYYHDSLDFEMYVNSEPHHEYENGDPRHDTLSADPVRERWFSEPGDWISGFAVSFRREFRSRLFFFFFVVHAVPMMG